ncbi:hypothetical protein [Agromyces cerinus]|uniref:Uncharacterized protein n=1 Tax=Agromyces cerinus subsp. cerinus TaxID=232089 RepID=A0A1N6GFF5_9MICO|nr:hypothetical protein [Agromyces cerinus]SIO06253.1 hypothetical protein SAMN05443544_2532 [Agromyces cerinus subsp. cerinus]
MSLEWPEWFMLGWLALVAVIAVLTPTWMPRPRTIGRFARTVGLPLDGDEELERAVGERLRLRAGWGTLGTLVGIAACVPIVLSGALTTHSEWGVSIAPFAWIVLLGVLFAGRGIGVAISILPAPPEVRRHGPRIARLPRPTVADYVAPIERAGARVLVAIGALLAVGVGFMPIEIGPKLLVGAATLGAIAVLVAVELVSAALVARPQPAVSEQLLRWDDALRAQTLRDLVSVPLMFGTLAVFAAAVTGLTWAGSLGDAGLVTVNVVGNLLIAASLVVLAFSIALKPARYYLKRLWPAQYADTQPPAYGSTTPAPPAPEGA